LYHGVEHRKREMGFGEKLKTRRLPANEAGKWARRKKQEVE